MSKKNVVSIEDRIPKLKQARKKKANRRLILYLSIFFSLISIIVYLQSPLSQVKTVKVLGNSVITDEEIIKQSGLSDNTNIWSVNQKKIMKTLQSNPVVNSASVKRILPWTVEIKITEYKRVGYIKEGGSFFPVIGNGTLLKEREHQTINGDAPLILNFTESDFLHRMTDELSKLPQSILNLISEVHWTPSEVNKNKIMLYMNDGFVVSGTIRDFANRMAVYPSIVSQIEPESRGIIHIGVGAYFEDFTKDNTSDNEPEG